MRSDFTNWIPISTLEIRNILNPLSIHWFIAGGWALDLHIGRKTRDHSDLDISIFRDQQRILYKFLKRKWCLFKANNGSLTSWDGEELMPSDSVWVSQTAVSSWAFQILLVDRRHGDWIYNRETTISKPIGNIYSQTPNGIFYLNPEIQLLYKGGSSHIREKDHIDLQHTLPFLSDDEKEWLKVSLLKQFPEGHSWITYLSKS